MTAHKLPLLLKELRLPTILQIWDELAETALKEGWCATKYLSALCEHEVAERYKRRIQRHLIQSNLPRGKTLETFDFAAIPSIERNQIFAFSSGDLWIEQGMNLFFFGPSGVGKTHLAAAIGEKLVENGFRVLFTRTTTLVQKLQLAKRDCSLTSLLSKLDKYHCLILDDFGYVKKDQLETNVLFELICERYERRSIILTSNQPFKNWDKIFDDQAMSVAAVDRLVHHSKIFEMNVESYRKKEALKQ